METEKLSKFITGQWASYLEYRNKNSNPKPEIYDLLLQIWQDVQKEEEEFSAAHLNETVAGRKYPVTEFYSFVGTAFLHAYSSPNSGHPLEGRDEQWTDSFDESVEALDKYEEVINSLTQELTARNQPSGKAAVAKLEELKKKLTKKLQEVTLGK